MKGWLLALGLSLSGCSEPILLDEFVEVGEWCLDTRTVLSPTSRITGLAIEDGFVAWSAELECDSPPCGGVAGFGPESDPSNVVGTWATAVTSIALDEGWIAVGLPEEGQVELFEASSPGAPAQVLEGAVEARYGARVAMSRGWLAVAVPNRAGPEPTLVGAVEMYRREGGVWTRRASLSTTARVAGVELAMEGEQLVVGLPGTAVPVGGLVTRPRNEVGRVEIYVRQGQTWSFRTTLPEPGTIRDGDRFGQVVALGRFRLAVGTARGEVRLFRGASRTWTELPRLSIRGAVEAEFGTSLSIQAARVWVGAPEERTCVFAPTGGGPCRHREGAVYRYPPGAGDDAVDPDLNFTAPSSGLGSALASTQDRLLSGSGRNLVMFSRKGACP